MSWLSNLLNPVLGKTVTAGSVLSALGGTETLDRLVQVAVPHVRMVEAAVTDTNPPPGGMTKKQAVMDAVRDFLVDEFEAIAPVLLNLAVELAVAAVKKPAVPVAKKAA